MNADREKRAREVYAAELAKERMTSMLDLPDTVPGGFIARRDEAAIRAMLIFEKD